MSRRCAFCSEVYGERDCPSCGRGMCDHCDKGAWCWDCQEDERPQEHNHDNWEPIPEELKENDNE